MKNFKKVAIVIAKIIIALLIIIPNVFIIHTIIVGSCSKDYTRETRLWLEEDAKRYKLNSEFKVFEGNFLPGVTVKTLISRVKYYNTQGINIKINVSEDEISVINKYRVRLEYSKDTYTVCNIIVTLANNPETFDVSDEGNVNSEELSELLIKRNEPIETETTIHYDVLLDGLLLYLPFLVCYIFILINIIITKKSTQTNKNKEIWLYIILIAIISIFALYCISIRFVPASSKIDESKYLYDIM